MTKKFSHELFGIEINANENKANYGIQLLVASGGMNPT